MYARILVLVDSMNDADYLAVCGKFSGWIFSLDNHRTYRYYNPTK